MDLGDPRLQAVIGVLLIVIAMAGLTLDGTALGLEPWARWFALTFAFFFGMAFTMRALTKMV